MKKDSTAIAVVLDKSGSMDTVRAGTISGFNEFTDNQKKEPGEATLTLVLFDTIYDVRYIDKPISEVQHLAEADYKPDGYTALNDAIARTITELGRKLAAKSEAERPEKVVVVIITDGLENQSQEYKNPEGAVSIRRMIEHQEKTYSWKFIFLGAGLKAAAQAASYGIAAGHAAQYDSGLEREVFKSASAATSRVRAGATLDFMDVERGSLRKKQ